MQIGDTAIPLTKDGEAILNWYGPSGTHTIYPMYKVINEMEGKQFGDKLDFKNKIIILPLLQFTFYFSIINLYYYILESLWSQKISKRK